LRLRWRDLERQLIQGAIMGKLYDTDIVAWASEQAQLLRGRQCLALDIENLAEEIEDVGKSVQRELSSRVAVLLAHLLKWKYQPGVLDPEFFPD
jgi:pyridoxine/pyridoxamine 5'-phosphate oxidase